MKTILWYLTRLSGVSRWRLDKLVVVLCQAVLYQTFVEIYYHTCYIIYHLFFLFRLNYSLIINITIFHLL